MRISKIYTKNDPPNVVLMLGHRLRRWPNINIHWFLEHMTRQFSSIIEVAGYSSVRKA